MLIRKLYVQVLVSLSALVFFSMASISVSADTASNTSQTQESESMSKNILLKTSFGDITIELNPQAAPKTVENFLAYIENGHFDNTIFHRVIPGFMIQGGGFTEDMQQKPTMAPIENEADNGLTNERGTIAMARTMVPDSATSQFFINLVDNDFLNFKSKTPQGYGYAVFGKVTSGMDVVDNIATVPTGNKAGHGDVPTESVVIESVTIIE